VPLENALLNGPQFPVDAAYLIAMKARLDALPADDWKLEVCQLHAHLFPDFPEEQS